MLPETITALMGRVAGKQLREDLSAAIADAIGAASQEAANEARKERAEQGKYNGWRNYATWRINLEIWSDYDWSEDRGNWNDAGELARYLEGSTDDVLTGYGEKEDGLALDYARSFVSDVDWYEIAESVIADYPDVIASDDDADIPVCDECGFEYMGEYCEGCANEGVA
jgi:hypothetical protein